MSEPSTKCDSQTEQTSTQQLTCVGPGDEPRVSKDVALGCHEIRMLTCCTATYCCTSAVELRRCFTVCGLSGEGPVEDIQMATVATALSGTT
jgi:hypothetical protein